MAAHDINLTLRKKINGVVYDLMVKTISDQVYINDTTTLTMELQNAYNMINLKANQTDLDTLTERFDILVKDAPEIYDTIKEIADYIDTHGDEFNTLTELVNTKVDKVEGMGLSTNDFTDAFETKLNDLYTRAELDAKLDSLETRYADLNTRLNVAESTISNHDDRITVLETESKRIKNANELKGGFHVVNTIAERDQLITDGIRIYPKMLCYVIEAEETFQLNDVMSRWDIYHTTLTEAQYSMILSYIEDNLSDRAVFTTENGINYITFK